MTVATKADDVNPNNDVESALEFMSALGADWSQHIYSIREGEIFPSYYTGDVSLLTADDDAARAAIIAHLNRCHAERRNVYFSPNPLVDGARGKKKAAEDDVIRACWVHVDIDPRKPVNPAKLSALALSEHLLSEQMRINNLVSSDAALKTLGLPGLPTIDIMSGRGRQLMWKLAAPFEIDGSPDAVELAKSYNQGVAQVLGGDHCHSLDHLLRLPGTVNFPSAQKRALGAVETLARFDAIRGDVAPRAAEFPTARQDSGADGARSPRGGAAGGNVLRMPAAGGKKEWCREQPEELPGGVDGLVYDLEAMGVAARTIERIVFGGNEDDPKTHDSRSENVFGIVRELLRKGVPEKNVVWIITEPAFAISMHVLDPAKNKAHRGPIPYAQRQVTRAKEANAKDEAAARAATAGFPEEDDAGEHGGGGGGSAGGGAPAPSGERRRGWPTSATERWQMSAAERPQRLKNMFNIALAILRLGVRLSFDEFAQRQMIEGLEGHGPRLTDVAAGELYALMDIEFRFKPARADFQTVVDSMCHRNRYHPVKDYFASLSWDDTPRLDTWLIDHGGAKDTELVRAQSRLFVLAAVARVFDPGVKFDQMPVLEGTQGIGKSLMIQKLCPKREWFTDSLTLNANPKETIEQTAGKLFVEVSELSGLGKASVEHVKSHLSKQSDEARLSYAKHRTDVQRQFVLVGTTNHSVYLTDETGNRRFWGIWTEKADHAAVEANRDQLWAEAVALYQGGASIVLPRELWAQAGEEQKARVLVDPWTDILGACLGEDEGRILSTDIYTMLGFQTTSVRGAKISITEQKRIASVMRTLGFNDNGRKVIKSGGRAWRGWVRGESKQFFCVELSADGSRATGLRLFDRRKAPDFYPDSGGHGAMTEPDMPSGDDGNPPF